MYSYCVLMTLIQYHFWNSSTLMYIDLVDLALFRSSWITWIQRFSLLIRSGLFQIWDSVNSAALTVTALVPGNVCGASPGCVSQVNLRGGGASCACKVHWKRMPGCRPIPEVGEVTPIPCQELDFCSLVNIVSVWF